jgi:hypothetical protein
MQTRTTNIFEKGRSLKQTYQQLFGVLLFAQIVEKETKNS